MTDLVRAPLVVAPDDRLRDFLQRGDHEAALISGEGNGASLPLRGRFGPCQE